MVARNYKMTTKKHKKTDETRCADDIALQRKSIERRKRATDTVDKTLTAEQQVDCPMKLERKSTSKRSDRPTVAADGHKDPKDDTAVAEMKTDLQDTASSHAEKGKKKKCKRPAADNNDNCSEKIRKIEDSQQDASTVSKENKDRKKIRKKKRRRQKDNSDKLASFLVGLQPNDAVDGKGPESANEEEGVVQTAEVQPLSLDKKDKKPKKKRPDIAKTPQEDDSLPEKLSAKKMALSYLKLWNKDRQNWSFKKVRQIWLIKNLYDAENINKKYFKYLLRYLEESKGGVRTRLIENAQSIYESSDSQEDDARSGDPVKLERARMIIQMLSE